MYQKAKHVPFSIHIARITHLVFKTRNQCIVSFTLHISQVVIVQIKKFITHHPPFKKFLADINDVVHVHVTKQVGTQLSTSLLLY